MFLVISVETAMVRQDQLGNAIRCVGWDWPESPARLPRWSRDSRNGGNREPSSGRTSCWRASWPPAQRRSFRWSLPSTVAPEYSLTAHSVAAGRASLAIAAIWWPIAFVMAVAYSVFISQRYAGKVAVPRDSQGFY